eukprot:1614876-Amphidinium_carterae.1
MATSHSQGKLATVAESPKSSCPLVEPFYYPHFAPSSMLSTCRGDCLLPCRRPHVIAPHST